MSLGWKNQYNKKNIKMKMHHSFKLIISINLFTGVSAQVTKVVFELTMISQSVLTCTDVEKNQLLQKQSTCEKPNFQFFFFI